MVSSARILVVEDSQTMLRIIKGLLESLGCTDVEQAQDVDGALVILHSKKVDLVLCDWTLADSIGLDLLNKLRADRRLSAVPLVMMIRQGNVSAIEASKRAGANNIIVKPFDALSLKRKIADLIGPRI